MTSKLGYRAIAVADVHANGNANDRKITAQSQFGGIMFAISAGDAPPTDP